MLALRQGAGCLRVLEHRFGGSCPRERANPKRGRLDLVLPAPGSSRRRAAGAACGAVLTVLAIGLLLPLRDDVTSATPALVLVVPCVIAALVGGRLAGLAVAVVAAFAFNLVFLRPYGTFKVDSVDDAIAFVVLGLVALTVATLVAREGERRRAALQRAAEVEALWRANEAMRNEQARITAEKRALEAVDVQRAALLRSVSHDLRTPLAAIRAVVSDLRDGMTYDAATRQELLDLVADEADRLDRLVRNLLSMSRIEAGSLQPERQAVPIDELLVDRVGRLSQLLRHVEVSLELEFGLPLISADYTMIEQVVTNLLENAARHSPPGSRIVVGARASGDFIEVSVTDNGVGIDPDEIERLFLPFQRGTDSRSSGLGLAICRAFVDAHNGTINVTRANGEQPHPGSRFTFTVPVHRG
jgi:two-component system, OmpR family, sensor histidine kinase KdpD